MAKIEIFPLGIGYSCTTLWVKNSLKIALSLTVFEIFTLFRLQLNRKWLPKVAKIANLINKLNVYKSIPYLMDNCFTSRRDRSRQMLEKDVLYIIPAGPVTECAFARCRLVLPSCLRQHDVIASFSFSKHIKTPSKLIAGPEGWALPVHWIGY